MTTLRRKACIFWLAGVALLLACTQARADAAQANRLLLEALQQQPQANIAGAPLQLPARVQHFYLLRGHQPVWNDGGELAGQAGALLSAIRASVAHGFNPRRYHLDQLLEQHMLPPARRGAEFEILATDAFLAQVRHRTNGVVSPRALDPDWDILAPELDAVAMLEALVAAPEPVDAFLERLWPAHPEYRQLVAERARILASGDTRSEPVPPGPLLKPGQSTARVIALKERLLGPGAHDEKYDETLQQAVLAFQRAAGLEADGIVGAATLEVLNANRVTWVDRIDANLDRWRWLPRSTPARMIRVNIAAFTLRVMEAERELLRMDVIAGKPFRRTPVFSEKMRYLVFNPYWTVPFKIAVQDKLPILQRGPGTMMQQGYEVSLAGTSDYRPLDTVDWMEVSRSGFRYQLRQRPGPANALGRVKFMLPNAHAVYLHDTPNRELFARQERAFSSGCIRLAEPLRLAELLLREDGQPEAAGRIAEILSGDEPKTVHLRTPVDTYLVYFTAFAGETGQILYRRDIYGRDAPIVSALRE